MKHYEAALLEAFPRGASGDVFYHWNKARQAIEQAEKQEPVAWVTDLEFDSETELIPARRKGKLGTDGIDIPLYVHPQREWVGLTDEEVLEICDSYYNRDSELVKMIEAKLKEKNHVN
jgi:hypothetical protein